MDICRECLGNIQEISATVPAGTRGVLFSIAWLPWQEPLQKERDKLSQGTLGDLALALPCESSNLVTSLALAKMPLAKITFP